MKFFLYNFVNFFDRVNKLHSTSYIVPNARMEKTFPARILIKFLLAFDFSFRIKTPFGFISLLGQLVVSITSPMHTLSVFLGAHMASILYNARRAYTSNGRPTRWKNEKWRKNGKKEVWHLIFWFNFLAMHLFFVRCKFLTSTFIHNINMSYAEQSTEYTSGMREMFCVWLCRQPVLFVCSQVKNASNALAW